MFFMRKVKFVIYEDIGEGHKMNAYTGAFHCWGQSSTEFETGPANDTVAIVELEDGQIKTPFASNVQFIDK